MTYEIWRSPTYFIVKLMKATGNRPGFIAQWKDHMTEWAAVNAGPDAQALKAWLPHFQVRPFYTATELAPILPALALVMRASAKLTEQKSAERVRHELEFVGLPYLRHGQHDLYINPQTHRLEKYFIVERIHYWSARDVSQGEFEAEFPS